MEIAFVGMFLSGLSLIYMTAIFVIILDLLINRHFSFWPIATMGMTILAASQFFQTGDSFSGASRLIEASYIVGCFPLISLMAVGLWLDRKHIHVYFTGLVTFGFLGFILSLTIKPEEIKFTGMGAMLSIFALLSMSPYIKNLAQLPANFHALVAKAKV